ncbi:alpha-pore-forming cytotoxin MakA [Pseudomonas rubra]|uniref:Alpha-helical pore-forming toxin family protein n=1 Tax=Pseudomonas rubra TaxID=2942627 RepID=A0ABT5PBX0_9PSED|nr:HBL/NHE enterotoxin family protein [Pseudomonas rubra]MDD1015697.1 alpha-helical pore-forming toxin family protein [Pseudomonas rubra]MDD1040319.1 alpha-helical pore-forming toxin family protein [Pseudomonas rubra]MDD1153910.1 alpha-helical pore-forming toxin family protein [Pseudomonas rubra]
MADSSATQGTDTLQNNTQSSFLSLNLITQACHGVLNTNFTAPSPKPSWFDDLSSKLDAAKATAQDWIDNLAPEITGGVPLQVINYGSTYSALSAQIQQIVQAHPDASGADNMYVKQVNQLVDALVQELTAVLKNADATSKKLTDWGDKMQKSHDDLTSGAANIQSAEADLQGDINKMNEAIKALNQTIANENKAIAASAGAIGLGILLTVVGIALAPETGGASLLVAGTGGLLVVGGAVTWGIMQKKINDQFDEIAKDQKELGNDQRQMVALQGLASSTSQAATYITTSTSALSDLRTSWNVFEGELSYVSEELKKAEGSLSTILQGAFTAAASKEWDDATTFAQQIAGAPVKLATANMPMDGPTVQVALLRVA